jgi:phosphate/sulfate permease
MALRTQQLGGIVWIFNILLAAAILLHVAQIAQRPVALSRDAIGSTNATDAKVEDFTANEAVVGDGVSLLALAASAVIAAGAGAIVALRLRPLPPPPNAHIRNLHPMYATPSRSPGDGSSTGGSVPRARPTGEACVQTHVQRIHHTAAQTPIEWSLPPSDDGPLQPLLVPVPQITALDAFFSELDDAYTASCTALLSQVREHTLYQRNVELRAELVASQDATRDFQSVSEDRGGRLRHLEVSMEGCARDLAALEEDKRDLAAELATVQQQLALHVALVQEKSVEAESARLRANKAMRELDEKLTQIVDLRRQLHAVRYERNIENETRDFGPPDWMPKAADPDFSATPPSVQAAVERYLTQRAICKS